MKNFFRLAVIAIAVLAFNACSNSDTPEKVAEKFLNHLNKKEFAEAKKLATPESAPMIEMQESFSKMGAGEPTKESKIENMKCKEEGEKATCEYTKDGESDKIELVKKDGKWLVEMKKETPEMKEPEISDSTAVQDTTQK